MFENIFMNIWLKYKIVKICYINTYYETSAEIKFWNSFYYFSLAVISYYVLTKVF